MIPQRIPVYRIYPPILIQPNKTSLYNRLFLTCSCAIDPKAFLIQISNNLSLTGTCEIVIFKSTQHKFPKNIDPLSLALQQILSGHKNHLLVVVPGAACGKCREMKIFLLSKKLRINPDDQLLKRHIARGRKTLLGHWSIEFCRLRKGTNLH